MTKIKAIVFDVGGILLPLDWSTVKRELRLDDVTFAKFMRDVQLWDFHHQYERGEISSEDFLRQLKGHLALDVEAEDLRRAWISFVGDVFPEMAPLLKQLKKKYKVYTLSNINEIHFEHIHSRNSIFADFDKFYGSHLMGARKPEDRIFAKLLKEIHCQAGEVLFFDDNLDNVQAALKAGIVARHIRSPLTEIPEVLRELHLL